MSTATKLFPHGAIIDDRTTAHYVLVSGATETEMEQKVNTYIARGYVPTGGIAMVRWEEENDTYANWWYCQAMYWTQR